MGKRDAHSHRDHHRHGHEDHAHDSGHGHEGHSHGVSRDADRRYLTLTLGLLQVDHEYGQLIQLQPRPLESPPAA